jgi:glycosyltransferase involved in cell wall biosynthesis
MKIIILGTAHPYRGGIATFNERLASQFVEEGNEVEVYTFTLQYPSFLFPGKTQYSSDAAPKNLKIRRKVNSINPLNWIKVGREIRKKKPDLLIFGYWMSFISPCFGTIARCAKNKTTTQIALIHNMLPHEPSVLDKFLPKYFVTKMDGFVAMAESVKNDILIFDKKNKPKAVSPHPIYDHYGELMSKENTCRFLKLNKDDKFVLFFGFIRKYKGLDLLLDAFADERIKSLKIKLLIVGEFYEDKGFYSQKIKDLDIENQVIMYSNYVSDSEVKYYFSAADIIAQPYKTATQSGVTQIAYHFEKPMLVTNVGGLAEIVPNGKVGYVVEANPKEIADALVDFFENKPDFSDNIKVEKEKYSWQKMTNSIFSLKF